MVAGCSYLLLSTAFTTDYMPYCSTDGSGLLIPLLVNSVPAALRTVLLSRWQRIAHSYPRQWLSRRFARRIALRMAAYCSFFLSLTAFPTVCALYCSVDGGRLYIVSLINCFHDGLRTVLLRRWQRIAYSSACERLFRQFARRIAQRMAVQSSYFRSSTAFTMVCVPYCSAVGSALLIPPLVNGFSDGSYAVLLSEWLWVADTYVRQWFSRRIACRFAL